MQKLSFTSLLVLAIVTLSSLAPASALRGKLPTDFIHANSPSHPPPPPHTPGSSSAAPRQQSSSAAPHAVSSSAAPSPVQMSSSASAPVPAPAHGAYPVNISVPFSHAPSTWSLRYVDGAYYRVENATLGERVQLSISAQWAASEVTARLQRLVGDDKQWKRQQKALKKHMKRTNWLYSADDEHSGDCIALTANSTCAAEAHGDDKKQHKDGKHGKHHDDKSRSLMSFYLRQSQCRACVQHNADMLNAGSNDSLSWLPSYAPAAVMKFCTLAKPKLAAEQSPAVTGAPLADWEGVCVPAEADCPAATLDMSILSPSTCAADEPVTKHSCTLCVLDGYTWQTSKRAFKSANNYAGQCVDASKASASVPHYYNRAVEELDSCPSAVYSMEMQQRYTMLAVSFGGFMSILGLLFFCILLRACCLARKTRQAALLAVARASASAAPAAVVNVPSVSSSPSPSAPPAAGYPAAQAAAQEYHEPLLSSGLNPPRAHVSAAYPQLYAQQVSVAQPAFAYGRM